MARCLEQCGKVGGWVSTTRFFPIGYTRLPTAIHPQPRAARSLEARRLVARPSQCAHIVSAVKFYIHTHSRRDNVLLPRWLGKSQRSSHLQIYQKRSVVLRTCLYILHCEHVHAHAHAHVHAHVHVHVHVMCMCTCACLGSGFGQQPDRLCRKLGGSPKAAFSTRACPRLPQASKLGSRWPAPRALLPT